MRVVCTAGHVDHGKSTLVKALTGMEPDRLSEEQERGLTIDLGFAWADLGDPPRTVAFVDLPGHERFVPNMLAGAGAIDLALFVVAADEGWMPQSQEHLDILDLLGVSHGVVAVTKADTVDPDTTAIAAELVREQLDGTSFAEVEIVIVSGRTGAGLDTLVERLCAALDAAPVPPDIGRPRLWVDRSFTIRGAGPVVTGTLSGGTLTVGEEVAILPAGHTARVRGLQTLKKAVDQAPSGSRVAVNLAGVDHSDVRRGDVLALAGQWLSARALDAHVNVLDGQAIRRKGAWHLHAGSAERVARVYPIDPEPITGSGLVHIALREPLTLAAGDRFVLRDAGRQATVAGGLVLDADPPARPRGRPARARRAEQLRQRRDIVADGDGDRLLERHVAERGVAHGPAAAAAVGLLSASAAAAAADHGLVQLGTAWAHPQAVLAWTEAVIAALRDFHRANPVARAAPRDVASRAAAAAGCPTTLTGVFLDALVASGDLAAEGPGLRTNDHRVELDATQAAARDALLATLEHEPFSPPNLSDAAARAGASEALVRELEAAGDIVRIADNLAVTANAMAAAVVKLGAAYAGEGPLTAARAKEVLGTTRKYALPLLEALDRRGHTRREGDVRHVR